MSKRKKITIVAIFLFVVLLVLGILWQQGLISGSDEQIAWRKIKNQPELVKDFKKMQTNIKNLKKNPTEPARYLQVGLDWKSLGELTNDEFFFKKSLSVYEEGIGRFGSSNIVFYLNGGKIAERLNDYAKAEKYFKKAIEISSADESSYLDLVDLYSYKMQKTQAEILAVFDEGQKHMMNSIPLISGRATYLRRVGNYTAALEDYETLSKAYPQNQGYKEIIAELQGLIKSNGQ